MTQINLLRQVKNLNFPEGFLINGKIITSVSSNNLTVAIKTLAGTDPTVYDPVYCRIDGVVRTITSALSVTANAGTNWFNLGSSELATKEVDLFTYLGYNTTDGVVIGFSRISNAIVYGDFSTTTTNEKYAGISTITNATSTDKYVNIGRFNAILSAGTGYTWSIPATSVIINYPIFETRNLDITPILTADTGTIGSISSATLKYKVIGNQVSFTYSLRVNKGTFSGGNVFVKLPFIPITETPVSGYMCDIIATTPYTQLGVLVSTGGGLFGLKQSYTAGLTRGDVSSDISIVASGFYNI